MKYKILGDCGSLFLINIYYFFFNHSQFYNKGNYSILGFLKNGKSHHFNEGHKTTRLIEFQSHMVIVQIICQVYNTLSVFQ